MLTLIAAHSRNRAIGKSGRIPWSAPEDLQAFKRETQGGAIIMGRKTWDSLPAQPLEGRFNIVVTSKSADDPSLNGAIVCTHPMEAMILAAKAGYFRIYGIGGEGIYRALMPHADRLLITQVDIDVEGADAFFPTFDGDTWVDSWSTVIREGAPRCTQYEMLRR